MLLRNKDIQTLSNIFASFKIPIEVWAYGSRVNGEAHEGSDLDLVIRSQNLERLPLNLFFDIKEKIQQSNIPILVELFDWGGLPERFLQNIEAHHEVLFSSLAIVANEPPERYVKNAVDETKDPNAL